MSETTTTSTTTTSPTATTGPGEVVSPALPEPGWRTSEFYLYLIPILLGALLTSGLFSDGSVWARGIGAVLAIFGALGYGGNRSKVKAAASGAGVVVVSRTPLVLAMVLALAGSQSACAAPQRETAIKTAITALDLSATGLAIYDKEHQESIVAFATSLDDGRARLAAYRAKRAVVRKAIVIAAAAIGVAATLNDDQSLAGMQAALKQVLDAVVQLTGGAP